MASITVKIDSAGLRVLCNSDEMKAALQEQADRLVGNANADAYSHVETLHIRGNRFEKPPYATNVKGGEGTAVAFANTATQVGAINEAKYKSLMRQLHG